MATPDVHARRPVTAVVMNLFYTGLGIARSLGEQGVPVIGLTAQRGVYGNFSRYVSMLLCADSRNEPHKLAEQLVALGRRQQQRSVIFPTRDHDLVFLDRFRDELAPYFTLAIPPPVALERCLNKWDTYQWALQAGVPAPKSWLIQDASDLQLALEDITYPCVLKPLAAHHWRSEQNWGLVGARKAISVSSRDQLLAEYAGVARADHRLLIQECIPGGDEHLVVAACYIDRQSTFQAGFNVQKLVQSPPGFGTGCIVQTVHKPELFERTIALLRAMEFSGIAEVEYKWDDRDREYKLIEVNPRPWDQHRLGAAIGVDLIHVAYCDYAGLPKPAVKTGFTARKWIAEETFLLTTLRLLWRRERGLGALWRQARGKKIYGIWSASDPLPFAAFAAAQMPALLGLGLRGLSRLPTTLFTAREKAAVRATQ